MKVGFAGSKYLPKSAGEDFLPASYGEDSNIMAKDYARLIGMAGFGEALLKNHFTL